MSAKPCGCDPEARHMCEEHQAALTFHARDYAHSILLSWARSIAQSDNANMFSIELRIVVRDRLGAKVEIFNISDREDWSDGTGTSRE